LKPHWRSSKLTAEQYESINREISRKIYEEVEDPGAVSEELKQGWERRVTQEVARAVASLKA
jgi:Txe/YoeB family toxin of Txe-Axe toxin-antitoxin module